MRKLNLGCGGNVIPGWENHDIDADISKPLEWPDNCFDFILAEHVIEHITPQEALKFLDECRRILAPNGTLRLCFPVLDRLPRDHARDIILGHGHKAVYNFGVMALMLQAAGFRSIVATGRKECDGHWREIGVEKDALETCRLEAMK